MRLGYIEVFLGQLIIYALVYLVNDYIGFMLCLIISVIAASLLLLSLVFELIDRSKVPRSFYFYMLTAVLAPVVVLAGYSIGVTGSFDWMND